MISEEIYFRELSVSRPIAIEGVVDMLTNLATTRKRGPVVYEIHAYKGQLHRFLGASDSTLYRLSNIFDSHGGNLRLSASNISRRTEVSRAVCLAIPQKLPLNVDNAAGMIRAALAAIQNANEDSVLQIIIGPAHPPAALSRNAPDPTANLWSVALGLVPKATAEQRKSLQAKRAESRFDCHVRIGGSSAVLHALVSALRMLESPDTHIHAERDHPELLNDVHIPRNYPLRLNASELACLLLLPVGETEEYPGYPTAPRLLLPPRWYTPLRPHEKGATFALSYDTPPRPLVLSEKDALMHGMVAGGTGVGKTTTLSKICLDKIEHGQSLMICDVKGDLIDRVAERLDPRRVDDVIYIEPGGDRVVGINPLEICAGEPSIVADTIYKAMSEIFSDGVGLMVEQYLYGAILTLLQVKDATLMMLPRLLTDDIFRAKILEQVHDPYVQELWSNYNLLSSGQRNLEVAPVLRRMRLLTTRRGIRSVLGQAHPKVDLSCLFQRGKHPIIMVNLNSAINGADTAKLLGGIVVGMLWQKTLARAALPPAQRFPVSIVLDELAAFLNLPVSLEDALSMSRSLGAGYILAFQNFEQLSPELREAVFTNSRSKVCFALSAKDARAMGEQAPELTPQDFQKLPKYSVYTTLMRDGSSTGWMSARTLPLGKPIRRADELKAYSLERYGVPVAEVEAELQKQFGQFGQKENPTTPPPTDTPIGRRKKKGGDPS